MSTIVINAWSIAFPLITNDIRVDISTQVSPLAIVASQTKPAPHPVRIWSFPGLVRTNYVFQMNEVDGAGGIVRQLAYFDIVPGNLDNVLVRGEEQIQVDTTPGLVSGTGSFTFDGSETFPGSGIFKPDYRGWEISPEEYSGVGTLIRGTDYGWDKTTGTFASLIPGWTFQHDQWYTIEFEAQAGGSGGSVPTVIDFAIRIITANTLIMPGDFGEKLLIEPAGNYLEVTLPPLSTVVPGRKLMCETQSIFAFKCVKFILNGTDQLKFMFGALYMMMNESISIYKVERGVGNYEWRCDDVNGNFKSIGQLVSDEMTQVVNRIVPNGVSIDKFQFARLYNECVLRLPIGQRVNYDDWVASPSNQKFYSLANSVNPANANKFFIPLRTDLFERNNRSGRVVGSFEPYQVGAHQHVYNELHANSYTGPPTSTIAGSGAVDIEQFGRLTENHGPNIGADNFPSNYSVNKTILV